VARPPRVQSPTGSETNTANKKKILYELKKLQIIEPNNRKFNNVYF
jgi:hypothetical protein